MPRAVGHLSTVLVFRHGIVMALVMPHSDRAALGILPRRSATYHTRVRGSQAARLPVMSHSSRSFQIRNGSWCLQHSVMHVGYLDSL